MKKLIALILICTLLVGCTSQINSEVSDTIPTENVTQSILSEEVPTFTGLDDTSLLNYIEDEVYENLVEKLNSEDYFVENVSTQYISKEYLEEVEYNSKENIYFGYTLSELDSCFQGKRYIFTSDDDGKTIVKEFEKYDDTYEQVIKNVAIGTGVILICVTVSVVSGGAGLPAMSAVFAVSAKTSAVMGLSSGIIGGVAAGLVTGIQTGNFEEAIKSGTLAGSNEFKWGAITGAIFGGASEAAGLKGATLNGLTMNEVASIQKESKYPLDVIKQFSNMEQYNICKRLCHNKQLINSHFYRGVSELPYKLLFAVIYTHLEFRYEVSHTITSHHVHHFHQTRIPDGTLLDYMVQYRKPLFPQFFLYPKKFLPENNPHHKEFHLRPYIQNNANQ